MEYREIADNFFKYTEFFRGIKVQAQHHIPENYIIDKYAVESPLGTNGKFKDMKFSKLGSAVFGNVESKSAPVRFEYMNDNGYEYWSLITNRAIKKGEYLFYDGNKEAPSFTDPSRF